MRSTACACPTVEDFTANYNVEAAELLSERALIMSEITQENSRYPALARPSVPVRVLTRDEQPLAMPLEEADRQLIELWLHGRSPHTQRVYRADASRFLTFTRLPLAQARLTDLQSFADALEATGTQPASRHRALAAIKSLFSFGHRLGYLPFDTAKPLRLPKLQDSLSDRIIDEPEVQRMLALERNPRNSAILFLLYSAGLRVSELCGLRWRDLVSRASGMGQVTVLGKGSKTRTVLVPSSVKAKLDALGGEAENDGPIFASRHRRAISPSQVLRIVKAAALRAGIRHNVVVHTFRHAHASHSLDRGAPIHLVQQTLGHADLSTTGRYLHARPSDSSANYLPL